MLLVESPPRSMTAHTEKKDWTHSAPVDVLIFPEIDFNMAGSPDAVLMMDM